MPALFFLCDADTISDILHDALFGHAPNVTLLVALELTAVQKFVYAAAAYVQHPRLLGHL